MTTGDETAAVTGEGPSWLARLIALEADGDAFLAPRSNEATPEGRLFGGLIAAQALAAAAATVPDRAKRPHSMHCYFVRGGRYDADLELVVDRTRDGRSFDTRRVSARQEGAVILEALVSFHLDEPGADSHPPAELPPLDATEPLELHAEMSTRFEMRSPAGSLAFAGPPYWIRARLPLEDDPLVHACAVTFISDLGLMIAGRPPEVELRFDGGGVAASLDHAIWFHRPFRPSTWHCHTATHRNHNGSRGLASGAIYADDGTLVASTAQESLWRV